MARRGRLFQSPLLTFGSVAGAGITCEWTLELEPVGDRSAAPGQRVELHIAVDPGAGPLESEPAVRIDVLPADGAGRPGAPPVVTLAGTGSSTPGDAPSGATVERRTTVSRPIAAGTTLADVRSAFVAEHPDDLTSQLLVARGDDATHLLTWWTVPPGPARALHFSAAVGELAPARTTRTLRVAGSAGELLPIELRLTYEDGAPMPDAEIEAAFAGGVRRRGRTDADGRVTVQPPPGVPEVFRVFLLSYPERAAPGPGPGPGPRPLPPPGEADTRPEVVAAFAFDSAFPAPAVHASLARVRQKAGDARETRLIVFGHTDKVGSATYNVALSERRAKAVLALLLDDRDMFESVAREEGWDTAVHQSMLRGVGCNPGAIDGQVGEMTRTATSNFQREYNEGVYHRLAAIERTRPTLAVDGNLSPATRTAIRDAYVAVAPHIRPERFAEPPFDGCGKAHHISAVDSDNRRAVVAFLPADTDLSQSSACERYDELVAETPADRRAPHFSDHQWLQEESGALHLSAATPVPDRTPARIKVVRCGRQIALPTPDGSRGGEPPELGATLVDLPAEIRGGVCYARWTSPDPFVLDPDAWLVDHDVQLEIMSEADHAEPGPGDPASGAALNAADGMRPPVFVARAGESWSVSPPPNARLERIRFRPSEPSDAEPEEGVALRSDGSLVRFIPDDGVVEPDEGDPILSLALSEQALPPTEGSA